MFEIPALGWSPGLDPLWGMRSESQELQSPSPLPAPEAKHLSILSDSSYFVPHSPKHKAAFFLYARHEGRVALGKGKEVMVTFVPQVSAVPLKEWIPGEERHSLCPVPAPERRTGQGPVISPHTVRCWHRSCLIPAFHRLPHAVPEFCECGDPERSPGCAEGDLSHVGEGRPPHTHCRPLQSH